MTPRRTLGLAAALLLAAAARTEEMGTRPLFSVDVPVDMVTGRVVVKANAADGNVEAVRWSVDDWTRMTPRPFELAFDAGPVPYERRVTAVALDKERRPLYRQEAVLNPGGRALHLEFRSPLDGQQLFGAADVELLVRTPADDDAEALLVDTGRGEVALTPAGPGLYRAHVELPSSATPLVARLTTRRGRRAERTVLVNSRGFLAEADAHVVEQLVGVSRGGRPLVDLRAADFHVKDDKGACEVRDAQLLTNAPLAVGLAIDTSMSLRHTEELKQATANQFLEQCLKDRDSAFLLAFGPKVVQILDWTNARQTLKERVLSLFSSTAAGTALYEAILRSIYRFQGQQGARALVLVTDGHDFDGEVAEESALAYARQSGVKIYALGLTSSYEKITKVTRKNEAGEIEVVGTKSETVIQPTNVAALTRITGATGGRLYLVKKAEDLVAYYKEIERDLRTQYLVSYVSGARRRNAYHPVEVTASRGSVHTASGFFY